MKIFDDSGNHHSRCWEWITWGFPNEGNLGNRLVFNSIFIRATQWLASRFNNLLGRNSLTDYHKTGCPCGFPTKQIRGPRLGVVSAPDATVDRLVAGGRLGGGKERGAPEAQRCFRRVRKAQLVRNRSGGEGERGGGGGRGGACGPFGFAHDEMRWSFSSPQFFLLVRWAGNVKWNELAGDSRIEETTSWKLEIIPFLIPYWIPLRETTRWFIIRGHPISHSLWH